jgi:hypothetical protein
MKKRLLPALCLFALPFLCFSESGTQPFGKVPVSDLELKECSFEKDANAMVLFDKGDLYFDTQFNIVLERHKRIKIFNEKSKDAADVKLEFYGTNRIEDIYDINAQTINIKDGKPVITKLDKKQVYRQALDKYRTAIIFTFPDIQNGSVIEYTYKFRTTYFSNFPTWYFQSSLPVRYSELKTTIPDMLFYRTQYRVFQQFTTNKTSTNGRSLGAGSEAQPYNENVQLVGLKDIPSLNDEPFMTSPSDNLQCVLFQLSQVRPIGGFTQSSADTWGKIQERLSDDEDFGLQLRKKLEDEDILIAKARLLKSDDEKIAFLFNEVRNSMKWNGFDNWYTNDGTPKAWKNKTGNATEINIILYHLLKQSEVKNVYPMIVSTRDNGRVNIYFPWTRQFNRTVVHIPVDSTKRYVLDASDKYNRYNVVPYNLLNSHGVSLDKEKKAYKLVEITNNSSCKRNIFINAEIKPEGKIVGDASISEWSYHKINTTKEYTTRGEEKYKDWLTEQNNNIKIKSFAIQGLDVDTIGVQEKIGFELGLSEADGDYIYFVPNLFSGLKNNPLLSEDRTTIIDFGANNKYSISGLFKLPIGYKTDAIPKNINLVMPDHSISFQRLISEADGKISVRYILDYKKSLYSVDEYPALREYYKKIYEMLNEQVVLKKI